MYLIIDGAAYDVKCTVRRTSDMKSSEISGDMMDGSYFNDVLGTYVGYEIAFSFPLYDQNKYAAIYEALTQPVDGHLFTLPYNNSQVVLAARVETVSDEILELSNGMKYWRNTRFAIISNGPSKFQSLGQVITRGRTPLPDISEPSQGTSYTWNGSQWVPSVVYEDADDMYF